MNQPIFQQPNLQINHLHVHLKNPQRNQLHLPLQNQLSLLLFLLLKNQLLPLLQNQHQFQALQLQENLPWSHLTSLLALRHNCPPPGPLPDPRVTQPRRLLPDLLASHSTDPPASPTAGLPAVPPRIPPQTHSSSLSQSLFQSFPSPHCQSLPASLGPTLPMAFPHTFLRPQQLLTHLFAVVQSLPRPLLPPHPLSLHVPVQDTFIEPHRLSHLPPLP